MSARGVEAELLRLFWGERGKERERCDREERQSGERGKRERRERERARARERESARAHAREKGVETEKIRGTVKAKGRKAGNNSRHRVGQSAAKSAATGV